MVLICAGINFVGFNVIQCFGRYRW